MAQARIGYRSKLAYGNADGPPETFTEIAAQTSCTPGDPMFDEVETTNQDSLAFRKEFLPTMVDGGSVTGDGNYDPADATQDRLRVLRDAGTVQNFRINIRDAPSNSIIRTITFAGYVKEFAIDSLSPLAVQKYKFSIRVTGAETWA
jgi:hypothetical protein